MQKTLKILKFKVVNFHINTMLRSPKVHYKSSDLFSILREHFGKDMNLARIRAMSMMICALCKVQRIAYTKLASAFDNEAGAGSSLSRIQERMANLFAIVMLAYVWCYLVGIYIHENIKKIKVLHHGRRAKSLFKYGLEYIAQCLLNHTNRYRIDIFKFLSYT